MNYGVLIKRRLNDKRTQDIRIAYASRPMLRLQMLNVRFLSIAILMVYLSEKVVTPFSILN